MTAEVSEQHLNTDRNTFLLVSTYFRVYTTAGVPHTNPLPQRNIELSSQAATLNKVHTLAYSFVLKIII